MLRAANGRGRIGCDDLADDELIEQHAESRRGEKPIATPQSVKTTLFGRMAALSLAADETDHFLEVLFPRSEAQRKANKEPERWDRIKAVLGDKDITPPQTRNTLWALYNAIVIAAVARRAKRRAWNACGSAAATT